MEMPSENNSCYQQGQAPSSLAAPSLPICRKHQPSPPWALTDLPRVPGEQKGTTGPQRLGSTEIKAPSIFRGERKRAECSQRGHHSQGCANSLCQADSVTLAFVGKRGFTPGKDEAPALPPLPSPLSKHRDRRLQSISRGAGTALHPICSSVLPGKE